VVINQEASRRLTRIKIGESPMKNMKSILLPAALLLATTTVGFAQNNKIVKAPIYTGSTPIYTGPVRTLPPFTPPSNQENLLRDIKSDMKDIQKDKVDIRKDKCDIRQDKEKLEWDREHDPYKVKYDRVDLHSDYKDLHSDKQDLRHDYKDLREDLSELHPVR
jgi:hypothetical protein